MNRKGHLLDRIQSSPDIGGGVSRIRDTRVPVWLLILRRKCGSSESQILRDYPHLDMTDLEAAREYYSHHANEIEQAIWLNETAANVPAGQTPAREIVQLGQILGLTDEQVMNAFDPPLSPEDLRTIWRETNGDINPMQTLHASSLAS